MQHFKVLRTISILLVFSLVTFGCATSKNHASNTDFGVTAEAVPEGILLNFINILADTTHLWISVSSWIDNKETKNNHGFITSYAGITDTSVEGWVNSTQNLDKVKQTGQVIFPIMQAGIKYHITAIVHNEHEYNLMNERGEYFNNHLFASTEFIAENGIYFNGSDVRLDIDE